MPTTLRVIADSLNLRDHDGVDSNVILRLPEGTKVVKLEANPANTWFKVQTPNGAIGWIAAKYAVDDAAPAPPAAPVTLKVTATTLNLRAAPNTDSQIVTQLPHGLALQRLGATPDGGWVKVRTPGGKEGFVSAKHVAVDDGIDPHAPRDGDPKWYHLAWGERGVKEFAGNAENPRIVEYQAATTFPAADDEIAWCSSFVNWCMKQAGVPRTKSAAARSWLEWGKKIDQPVRGCVVVFKRGDPPSGHVALYVGREGDDLLVLGGNQDNQVKISRYAANRVLGFRLPA